jgi:hypothetical protein
MRTCLFCGSPGVTREHIWPEWIGRVFPPIPRWQGGVVNTKNRDIRFEFADTLKHTARCACGTCNHGWMNDLEKCTKPILETLILPVRFLPRTMLPKRKQKVLAQWIALRTMVWDSQNAEADRYYSPQERERFAQTRSLKSLSHVHVWLATCPNADFGAEAFVRIHSQPAKLSGLQAFTCRIGDIALQFVAWKRLGPAPFNLPALNRAWSGAAPQIWPNPVNLPWPPDFHLDRRGLESFVNRVVIGPKFRLV